MALRAGILCSYAVMLEPVMMHSWAGTPVASTVATTVATSCHTNLDETIGYSYGTRESSCHGTVRHRRSYTTIWILVGEDFSSYYIKPRLTD